MDRHHTPPPQAIYPLTPPPTGHRAEKLKNKIAHVISTGLPPPPLHFPDVGSPGSDVVIIDGIELPAIIRDAKQPSGSPGPTVLRFINLGPPTPETQDDAEGCIEIDESTGDALLGVFNNAMESGIGKSPLDGIPLRTYQGPRAVWWCPAQDVHQSAPSAVFPEESRRKPEAELWEVLPETGNNGEKGAYAEKKKGKGKVSSGYFVMSLDNESDAIPQVLKHESMIIDDDEQGNELVYVRTERSRALIREPAAKSIAVRNSATELIRHSSSTRVVSKRPPSSFEVEYNSDEETDIEFTGSLQPISKRARMEEQSETRSSTPLREAVKCSKCNCRCGGETRGAGGDSSDDRRNHHRVDSGAEWVNKGKVAWSKSLPRHVLGNILHALLNEGGSLRTKWGNRAGHWAELAVAMGAQGGDHDRVRNVARRMQEYLPEMMRRGQI